MRTTLGALIVALEDAAENDVQVQAALGDMVRRGVVRIGAARRDRIRCAVDSLATVPRARCFCRACLAFTLAACKQGGAR